MHSGEVMYSREEMEAILRGENVGFLGMCREGKPYVVPLTYVYENGRIVFHCAWKGQKLEYIKANPQVCFTVGRQYGAVCRHPQGAQCLGDQDSVICLGKARILEDEAERRQALNAFNRGLMPGVPDIPREAAARCCAVEIAVEKMTGRQQREGNQYTDWEYCFPS